jgi:hypothetical protein
MMKQISKHREYRSRVKAKAVRLKGGRCQQCGFDDERALHFHNIEPVRRLTNGLRRQAMTSTATHRAVVRGDGKGIKLWCANCIAIDMADDWTQHVNTSRTSKRAVMR